jgi:glycosyltransferase involved in cell wall biosynthesis
MRILHIVTAFPRSRDDVIVPWLVVLLKRLRAAGHDVEVLTSSYRGLSDQDYEGIPVHRFRYFPRRWESLTHDEAAPDRMKRSLMYRFMPGPFVIAGMTAACRLSRRRRYDVIHVHWPLPLALLGWAAQRARPAKLVTTFYGAELQLAKQRAPWRRFLAWAARRSDRVIAISDYTAREVRELAPVAPTIIPYTTAIADPGASAVRARATRDGRFTVLFVGRLVERKGVTHLVQAMRELPGDLNARLVIVGEGPERESLERQVAAAGLTGRVELRGRIPHEELERAYATADVFVLPAIVDSRGDTEGLGVVLLEAMSHGVPVIASRVGGIPDIVVDGEAGLLVPPGNAGALAAAIERIARDSALAERLGAAGVRRLREQFSWEAVTRRYLDVYASLVNPR